MQLKQKRSSDGVQLVAGLMKLRILRATSTECEYAFSSFQDVPFQIDGAVR